MKKVVVSTFNSSKNNYGGVFQACALYSFLTKMGYDVSYVTIEKRTPKKINIIERGKILVKKILRFPIRKKIKLKEREFQKFTTTTQKQIIFRNEKELNENPPYADAYISGSDQVWNPVNIHEDFFLAYVPEKAKKIAYAASMGNEIIPENNKERFARFISRYDSISIREDSMYHIIEAYTGKHIHQNIDPVFLMDKNEWEKLKKPYKKLKYKKYILAYVIEWNAEYNQLLKELKQRWGLPVIFVNLGNFKKVCADQVIYDASPNEFLAILDGAEMVVATSFHGVAMSIVFNKRVVPLVGNNKPTRIESLLRHFNLSYLDMVKGNEASIDYEIINKIIQKDREEAKEYLLEAIER